MQRISLQQKFKKWVISLSFLILMIGFSLVLGWGSSQVMAASVKSMEEIPEAYQAGFNSYLKNCSSCHISIPPEVLPTETWKKILENPLNHYGTRLTRLIRLDQVLIWNYVSAFSRPLIPGENQPQYIIQSRYFKALHPKVELPQFVTHRSCVECHVNAAKLDYQWTDNN